MMSDVTDVVCYWFVHVCSGWNRGTSAERSLGSSNGACSGSILGRFSAGAAPGVTLPSASLDRHGTTVALQSFPDTVHSVRPPCLHCLKHPPIET